MSVLKSVFIGFVFTLLCGCAANPSKKVVVTPGPTDIYKDPMEIEFAYVKFRHVPFESALLALSHEIYVSFPKAPRFNWGAPGSLDPKERDRLSKAVVSIEASHIRLKDILNQMCTQVNWSYKKDTKGYSFFEGS